ncbi:hypothetical protein Tco_0391420, partial [Tanacetum coccineum]
VRREVTRWRWWCGRGGCVGEVVAVVDGSGGWQGDGDGVDGCSDDDDIDGNGSVVE